ncbi:MAG: DUF2868 domain-containing protein [Casimicrobiaceae bacterium]
MDERNAIAVVAVRALETTDGARAVWTDADRAWASRAAAQVVGEAGGASAFVARRAQLALERVGERSPLLPRAVRALRWRPWAGVALVVLAFVVGAVVDHVGGGQSINVVWSPVAGVLAWNLAVYVALGVGLALQRRKSAGVGPLQRGVVWLAARGGRATSGRRASTQPMPVAVAAFAQAWAACSAPLYAARAARILHLAAAAFALGLILGLYVRGIALEYRATWESTFVEAPVLQPVLAVLYAPGAWLLGTPVPDAAQLAAIRAPASENAAQWLHLMAATLLLVVIVPRLLLALAMGLVERRRAARLAIALDAPYFQRLLRGLHEAPVPVTVVPYSFTPDTGAVAALTAIASRALGGNVAVTLAPTVAYGDEDRVAAVAHGRTDGWTVALFNLAATPEAEAHGAFLAALAKEDGAVAPSLIVIDEAAWRARGGDPVRSEARRALWRDLCAEQRLTPMFVDLAAPDLDAAELAFEAALGQARP